MLRTYIYRLRFRHLNREREKRRCIYIYIYGIEKEKLHFNPAREKQLNLSRCVGIVAFLFLRIVESYNVYICELCMREMMS